MTLVGGAPEPADRLGVVAADAGAAGVHTAQSELGLPVLLRGRAAIPADRLGIVLGNPETGVVPQPEAVLGAGMPLVGGQPVPVRGPAVVPGNAGAGHVEAGEIELRRRIARLGPGAQLVHVLPGLDRDRQQHGAGADDQRLKEWMPGHRLRSENTAGRIRSPPNRPGTNSFRFHGASAYRAVGIATVSTMPAPSSIVIVRSAGTAPIRSTRPLGQVTSTASARVRPPSPKVTGSSLCDR